MQDRAITTVCFDIGHTLVGYKTPLNWSALYEPALEQTLQACGADKTKSAIDSACAVLQKYNTRVNPREKEFPSEVIFGEIIDGWGVSRGLIEQAQNAFFGFFQSGAECYGDAAETLRALKARGMSIGVLTDVAYGMGHNLALGDIAPLLPWIDTAFTSVDVGYRKPHTAGFRIMLDALGAAPGRAVYIGDEEKDIVGANAAGMSSVLINRGSEAKSFGQTATVASLSEIIRLLNHNKPCALRREL